MRGLNRESEALEAHVAHAAFLHTQAPQKLASQSLKAEEGLSRLSF
jgi:hypothetical protein